MTLWFCERHVCLYVCWSFSLALDAFMFLNYSFFFFDKLKKLKKNLQNGILRDLRVKFQVPFRFRT